MTEQVIKKINPKSTFEYLSIGELAESKKNALQIVYTDLYYTAKGDNTKGRIYLCEIAPDEDAEDNDSEALEAYKRGYAAGANVRGFIDGICCTSDEADEGISSIGADSANLAEFINDVRRACFEIGHSGGTNDNTESEDGGAAPPEKTLLEDCRRCWCDSCENLETCDLRRDGAPQATERPWPCTECKDGARFQPKEKAPNCDGYVEGDGLFNNG